MKKRLIQITILIAALPIAFVVMAGSHYGFNYNWRTVDEGAFYGARQMGPAALKDTIEDYGIRTVINLRGESGDAPWYQEEVQACHDAGIAHVDFDWSRNRLPTPESLAAYLDLLDHAAKPILAHCQGGTHRTGLAAAAYELWRGKDTETARKQFGLFFRDAPIGGVIDRYEGSPLPFRQWVLEVYPAHYEVWKAEQEAAAENDEEVGEE